MRTASTLASLLWQLFLIQVLFGLGVSCASLQQVLGNDVHVLDGTVRVRVKNMFPVALERIYISHCIDKNGYPRCTTKEWFNVPSDSVPSGELEVRYPTGLFAPSDWWKLEITFEGGEKFTTRKKMCVARSSDDGKSPIFEIYETTFKINLDSGSCTVDIDYNDGPNKFDGYAFARIKNEYDQTFDWASITHVHGKWDSVDQKSWKLSIPSGGFSPAIPVYFTTGLGDFFNDHWNVRAQYPSDTYHFHWEVYQEDERKGCWLRSGDRGKLFHIGVRGKDDQGGDFIIDIPSGSCTVGLKQKWAYADGVGGPPDVAALE